MAAILMLEQLLLTVPAIKSHNMDSSCLEARGQVMRGLVAAIAMHSTTSLGTRQREADWTASSLMRGMDMSSMGGRVVIKWIQATSM